MTIKEILDKFKSAPLDRTLARDLEITAKVSYVPNKAFGGYIKLEDNTGTLEAVPANRRILEFLQSQISSQTMLKFKGRLDKTEFGNIAFDIEEILE